MFNASKKAYKKKTKKNLDEHPLMTELETCKSPAEILGVLQKFEQATSGNEELRKWLTPAVNVLCAWCGVIGGGVGIVSSFRTILLRSTL